MYSRIFVFILTLALLSAGASALAQTPKPTPPHMPPGSGSGTETKQEGAPPSTKAPPTTKPAPPVAKATTQPPGRCVEVLAPGDSEDAKRLTMLGVRCFKRKRYARALQLYRQAFLVEPSPLLDAASGRALHKLGLWSLASVRYQRYVSTSKDEAGREKIRKRLAQLDRDLKGAGMLTVTTSPGNAAVSLLVDGFLKEPLGAAPLRLRLAPGRYTLVIERSGHFTQKATVTITKGGHTRIERELVSLNSATQTSARAWRRTGLITMAAGLPLAITGTILRNIGDDRIEEASDDGWDDPEDRVETRRQGRAFRDWGTGLMVVGSAALLTGGIVALVGAANDDAPEPEQVAPPSEPKPARKGSAAR